MLLWSLTNNRLGSNTKSLNFIIQWRKKEGRKKRNNQFQNKSIVTLDLILLLLFIFIDKFHSHCSTPLQRRYLYRNNHFLLEPVKLSNRFRKVVCFFGIFQLLLFFLELNAFFWKRNLNSSVYSINLFNFSWFYHFLVSIFVVLGWIFSFFQIYIWFFLPHH